LPPVKVTTALAGATGITVSYKTNTGIADVSATDQIMAFGKTVEGELIIARKARGGEAVSTILIPYQGISASDVACCRVVAMREDGMQVSDSTYTR